MATYAIGDIQGCYTELRRLLDKLDFDPCRDKLWCVGDLVNRGPDSLAVLRWFKALGERAVAVLGNHDLHLLAVATGGARRSKKDTLDAILTAPDRDELLYWLRHLPVMYRSEKKGFALLHAGLPPQWDIDQAESYARELEAVLRAQDHVEFLSAMYSDQPTRWHDDLSGIERLRFITNCFTRLRWCDADGNLLLHEKGGLENAPPGVMPWFAVPGRRTDRDRILFGHWSTIGYRSEHNVWALDSGCLWGGRLSALRVRRKKPMTIVDVNCDGYLTPSPE